jgi:GR25 family glycosyltransferase involved in LPS biosynthesis
MLKNKAKWDDILKTIKSNGFPNCVIFEAVNGAEYTSQNLENMVGIWERYILKNNMDRTNHEQFNKLGALGCYLSHVSIWQDAKSNGYKNILIFEDDISFQNNFIEEFKKRIEYIPKDYDIFFLDVMKSYKSVKINKYFNKIESLFFGTHSYSITKKAIDIMLKTVYPIEVQIDSYMSYAGNLANLSLYYTSNLCNQMLHFSDIQTPCIVCDTKYSIFSSMSFVVLLLSAFIVFIVVVYAISKSNQTV